MRNDRRGGGASGRRGGPGGGSGRGGSSRGGYPASGRPMGGRGNHGISGPTEEVTALLYREGLFPERDLEDQWEEAGSRTVPHTRRLHLRRWQGDGCVRIILSRLGFSSIL